MGPAGEYGRKIELKKKSRSAGLFFIFPHKPTRMKSPITVKVLIPAFLLFSVFYLAPGCTKTVVQHINHDTTIYKDTTIVVDSNLDRQLVFSFDLNTGSITPTPQLAWDKIYKFNKHNYAGVDSIVFMADPYVANVNPSFDPTDSCVISLYNVTDGVPIAGGQFRTRNADPNVFVQTGNLYNALPDKEITLGVTVLSTKDESNTGGGTAAAVTKGYLFLFRK